METFGLFVNDALVGEMVSLEHLADLRSCHVTLRLETGQVMTMHNGPVDEASIRRLSEPEAVVHSFENPHMHHLKNTELFPGLGVIVRITGSSPLADEIGVGVPAEDALL